MRDRALDLSSGQPDPAEGTIHALAKSSKPVTRTTLLVPIHYPLKASTIQTLTHSIDFADQFDNTRIIILHVNLLHKGEKINRTELRCAIEEEVELPSNLSSHARDAYLVENAILEEADHQNADYVIIGKSMRPRWRQLLADYLGIGIDLESILRHQLNAELIVIESASENSRL